MYQPIFRYSTFTIRDPQHLSLSQVGDQLKAELPFLGRPFLEAFLEDLCPSCLAFLPSTACATASAAWSG